MVRSPSVADDITQAAWVVAIEGIYKLEHPRMFLAWMRRIVLNKTYRYYNKQQLLYYFGLDTPVVMDETATPPDIHVEFGELNRQLNELPPNMRLIYILRHVEQLTVADIADRCGISGSTVKRRLKKADKKLSIARRDPPRW